MRMDRLDVQRVFRDCDARIDVKMHATNWQAYRDALHEAIQALQCARQALLAVVHTVSSQLSSRP